MNIIKSLFLVLIIISLSVVLISCDDGYVDPIYYDQMKKTYNIWNRSHKDCCKITYDEWFFAKRYNRIVYENNYHNTQVRYRYNTIHDMVIAYNKENKDNKLTLKEWIIYKKSES